MNAHSVQTWGPITQEYCHSSSHLAWLDTQVICTNFDISYISKKPVNPGRIRTSCRSIFLLDFSWWRHQMETFSTLLAIGVGNSPFPSEFPAQRPVTGSFGVYFDLHPNKRLSKQWLGWWFKTPSCPLWRHRNAIFCLIFLFELVFDLDLQWLLTDIVQKRRPQVMTKYTPQYPFVLINCVEFLPELVVKSTVFRCVLL